MRVLVLTAHAAAIAQTAVVLSAALVIDYLTSGDLWVYVFLALVVYALCFTVITNAPAHLAHRAAARADLMAQLAAQEAQEAQPDDLKSLCVDEQDSDWDPMAVCGDKWPAEIADTKKTGPTREGRPR